MKYSRLTIHTLALALALLSTLNFQLSTFAQGTAFTYQGRLNEGASRADGSYDLTFSVWNAAGAGTQQGSFVTNTATVVSNGLFTVTLDFGNQFPGADRWLEIAVRTNGVGAFGLLNPRQKLTPTPYAIYSGGVNASGISGTITAANIASGAIGTTQLATGAVTSNKLADGATLAELLDNDGSGSGLDADLLDGLHAAAFWQLGGNAGTTPGTHFLGTADNQPLEIKVNGLRSLRVEPNASGAPNLIGGSPRNFVGAGVVGATIAGGGTTNYFGVPYTNSVSSDFGFVGGGYNNTIAGGSVVATIAGGRYNNIGPNSYHSMIGGGNDNHIGTNSHESMIGGGNGNNIGTNSTANVIAGGSLNKIEASPYSAIGGGSGNSIGANADAATIAGGALNGIGTNCDFSVIAGGYNNIISASSRYAVIAGGNANLMGTIAYGGTIGGGQANEILANSVYATIPGGAANSATNYAFAAGYYAKAVHSGAFVWADTTGYDFASTGSNQFLIRASGGMGVGTPAPATALHVKDAVGATEISVESSDVGGHRWTLQSSGISGSASLDASFQIIDRTLGGARLLIGTNGFVGIGTSNPTNKLHVAGGVSATAFVTTSDRNAKENFRAVSPAEVLIKVTALPITTWNFKEMKDGQHLGPMAQDFYAAFGLGGGETTITTVDADGVALAAIQGLNEKVEEKESRIRTLEKELSEIKRLLVKLTDKGN